MCSAIKRVQIKDLDLQNNNIVIVGIIICKQRPQTFGSSTVDGNYRGVWNFTLRDSVQHYINIAYWNTGENIINTANKFHIGDIVEIIRPKLSVRHNKDNSEQFRPMVTSPFFITLNEKSDILLHCNQNIESFLSLLNYPTKPIAGFIPIRDIQTNGSQMKNTVDILGVVKYKRNIRSVKMNTSESTCQVLDFEIFDQSCLAGLKVSTWDPEFISRSVNWKVRMTVLFLTDVKLEWSDFHKSYLAKTTSRTIITEDPVCKETKALLDYAKDAPISTYDIADGLVSAIPDANSIQDVMSIKRIQNRINAVLESSQSGEKQFTALVFAKVTKLDLDGFTSNLRITCSNCNCLINPDMNQCENLACVSIDKNATFKVSYDIRIDISDHTGGLKNCRLCGTVAEKALGCSAREFQHMSCDDKARLKWHYLMELCAIPLSIFVFDSKTALISVIDLNLANIYEVAQRLPTI